MAVVADPVDERLQRRGVVGVGVTLAWPASSRMNPSVDTVGRLSASATAAATVDLPAAMPPVMPMTLALRSSVAATISSTRSLLTAVTRSACQYTSRFDGKWRSSVAHLLWEQGVGGSNPPFPTICAHHSSSQWRSRCACRTTSWRTPRHTPPPCTSALSRVVVFPELSLTGYEYDASEVAVDEATFGADHRGVRRDGRHRARRCAGPGSAHRCAGDRRLQAHRLRYRKINVGERGRGGARRYPATLRVSSRSTDGASGSPYAATPVIRRARSRHRRARHRRVRRRHPRRARRICGCKTSAPNV